MRLRNPNVLAAARPTRAAWPVPAQGRLHLALDAAARPQHVQLLDALGRVVLAQPATKDAMSLKKSILPIGVQVLRVAYATGRATHRVALE